MLLNSVEMRISIITTFLFCALISFGQGIHQEQLNHYNSLAKTASWYENNTPIAKTPTRTKSNCNLEKIVYGWHPYWSGNTYQNYDWDLLSHFSYFSYEVNANTGNANDTHGFSTSSAVTAALSSGNTKVTLCVTLFNSHATLLNSSTAKQTLISNLVNLIQNRGAHGVNIDFEGLPSSQKTNFANFMVDLANQMHAAVPNSHVSTVLYAVDWNDVFDFSIMNSVVDHFIIMGYDYYWRGSATTGPNDPLFHFGSNYNFTLSKSVSYYLDKGAPKNKLVLGLPYYGRQWATASTTVPTNTTAQGTPVLYKDLVANPNGFYSAANHQYENDSYTDIYVFNNNGTKQCFITEDTGFRKRLEFINNAGIAGLGIWALGYDDGYNTFWSAIEDYLTDCSSQPCPGSIHDFGGPTRDYYNNEDYTWTIAPPNAGSITVNFSSFDLENNFDFLTVYDGPNTSSPQIAGSPFTGSSIQASFTSSIGALTFRFTSDGGNTRAGFNGIYTCSAGSTAPSTAINPSGTWQTADFNVSFNDQDNVAVTDSFYLVSDFDGNEWRSNTNNSYLYEKFSQSTLHPSWSGNVGTWNVVANELKQTDETSTNTNVSTTVSQTNQNTFLYEWKGKIEGTGTNKRFGLHFFSDGAMQTDRNNSYLVYWYPDQGKCRLHKSTNNVLNFITETNVSFNAGNWYNFKVYYNPGTGIIKAYLDGTLVLSYTDNSPLQSGTGISFRTGEATGYFDDIKVFKNRGGNASITIGSPTDEIRFQNANATTPAGKIESIVLDGTENWSSTVVKLENIDWTNPTDVVVNDGPGVDINTFSTANQIEANWSASTDNESGLMEYIYAIGTTAGGTNVVNWTSNGTNTSFTHTGLTLTSGVTYYISVIARDNAMLESTLISSNGQTLNENGGSPLASFNYPATVICPGDSISFTNTSINATTYSWSFSQGSPASSSLENPKVVFPSSGSYTVSLVAIGSGGTDILTQNINIVVSDAPVANFTPISNPIYLPNATAYFNNNSTNANDYNWDFGNGETSVDQNPWSVYTAVGTYPVKLVADNGVCGTDSIVVMIEVKENTVGINEQLKTISKLNLYPNPFTDNITLSFTSDKKSVGSLSVYNLVGELIEQQEIEVIKGENSFNPLKQQSGLASGKYLLKVEVDGAKYSTPFVKF